MKAFFMLASLLATSVCAHAVTITSGSLTTNLVNGSFHFVGSEFDLKGSTDIGAWLGIQCSPCEPGTTGQGSGQVSDLDIGSGSGSIGGTVYPYLDFSSHLMGPGSIFEFTAPSFTYNGESSITLSFTFSGYISAYDGPYQDSDCILCRVPIQGSGYTVIRYNVSNIPAYPPGTGFAESQTFYFTPEPATAYLLMPTVLALFIARKRLPFLRKNA